MSKKLQSLHSHTLLSDGKLTHQESLEIAQKVGIEYLAFTEHDVLPTKEQIQTLRDLKSPVKWFVGIELAAGLPKELGGGSNGPHMIGLFVDPFNKGLLEHCRKSLEHRVIKMEKMVKNLARLGFDINMKDVNEVTTGESVGQPHLVTALQSKQKNLDLIDEYIEKLKKAGEKDARLRELYQGMMQQGAKQYVYALFLREDAFLAEQVRVPYEYWLDFDQAVKLIRGAGGISSFAHYAMHKVSFPLEMVEKLLKEDRVDGAETVYGLWTKGTDDEKQTQEDRDKIRGWVEEYNRIATGGADAHSEKDFIDFAENIEYSAETVGMVENIIEKKQVLLDWTNFKS